MHFSRMGAYEDGGSIPVIVKGEGTYIYDDRGKRYFDGISSLFTVQVGHGREERSAGHQVQVVGGGFGRTAVFKGTKIIHDRTSGAGFGFYHVVD